METSNWQLTQIIQVAGSNPAHPSKRKIMNILNNYEIDPQTSCWNWMGGMFSDGYGCMYYQGKTWRVHRLSWQLLHGDIPEGKYVCHHCDNKKCINPGHLFLGSAKDNTLDMIHKGRHVPYRKLTLEQAIEIKNMLGTESHYKIAKLFNVSRSAIQHIAAGRSWKFI